MGARGNVDVGGQSSAMKPVTNGASRMPARSQAPRPRPTAPPATTHRAPTRPGMIFLIDSLLCLNLNRTHS